MIDCKKCKYGDTLYIRKRDKDSLTYAKIDRIQCSGPRYNGRSYICKSTREACRDFVQRSKERTAL